MSEAARIVVFSPDRPPPARGSTAGALVRLARPFTLLPPMVGIASGAVCAFGATDGDIGSRLAPVLVASGCAGMLNAASNALNQLTDLESDRWNKPDRPLVTGALSPRQALLFAVLAYGAALLPTPWLGLPVFACFAAAAVATLVYSVPAFGRTKARGFLANLTIAVPRGMLLKVAGWATVASVASSEPWVVGSVFGLFLLGAASTKDFADVEGDRRDGCRTLPVVLGPRRAARIVAPFLVLPWLWLALAAWLPDPIRRDHPLLTGDPVVLTVVALGTALWGLWTARSLLADPDALTRTENHPAWRSMYGMMLVAQAGVAVAYLV